jgi:hypothetical protein
MRAKICTVAVNMTAYPSVRKPALDAPEPIELEFARDTSAVAEIAAHQIPQSRPAHASALKPQSAMLRT